MSAVLRSVFAAALSAAELVPGAGPALAGFTGGAGGGGGSPGTPEGGGGGGGGGTLAGL